MKEYICRSDHLPVCDWQRPPSGGRPSLMEIEQIWEAFRSLFLKQFIQNDITYSADYFKQKLITIAKKCIPHNPTSCKRERPWFNKGCWVLQKSHTELTTFNLTSSEFHRANVRKTIKEAKRNSCQNYMNKMNISSKLKTVWNMIRKIAGKKQTTLQKHLSITNSKITTKMAIADRLTKTFPNILPVRSIKNFRNQTERRKDKDKV